MYFCNIDFGRRLTGIERSAMRRANLFVEHLGIVPCMLTSALNLHAQESWRHYQSIGWVNEKVPLRNVYDELMRIESGSRLPATIPACPDGWRAVDREGGQHQRVYDADGNFRRYVVWRDRQKAVLDYINYFHDGKRVQRDKFNRYGQLAVSQRLTPDNRVLQETCHAPDGSPCLDRLFDDETGKVRQIRVFGDQGLLQEIFSSEEALFSWWLAQTFRTPGNLFLIDRNRVWTRPLVQLKRQCSQTLLSAIHNHHLGMPPEDLAHGRLNINYRDILTGQVEVDACVVLTEQQQKDIETRFPNHEYRLYAIPHANDEAVERVDFGRRNLDRLVTFARLSAEKRLPDMLKIMQLLIRQFPQKTLHIYGEGAERKLLEEQIAQLGLSGHVVLEGYVENVGSILDQAGLYLCTSQFEAFSASLLESLSHGCPVLSYDVTYGPASLVKHGNNGYLVPSGDVEAAAAALCALFRQPEQLARLSSGAYDSMEDFSGSHVAQRWKAVLAQLSV